MSIDNVFVPIVHDERTWDRNGKIVFFDESFLAGKIDKKSALGNYIVLDYEDGLGYTDNYKLSYDIAKSMTNILNQYHGVKYPVWYWHGLMILWLTHVIFSIYDKCHRVECLFEKYKDSDITFQNVIYDNDIPINDDEFRSEELSSNGHYTSAYMHILKYYNCKFDTDNVVEIKQPYYDRKKSLEIGKFRKYINKFKQFLKSKSSIYEFLKVIMGNSNFINYYHYVFNKPNIALVFTDFDTEIINKVVHQSEGRIQPIDIAVEYPSNHELSNVIRDKIKAALFGGLSQYQDKWVKILIDYIPYHIPYCFIEDYAYLIRQIPERLNGKNINAILTTTGFYHTIIRMVAMTLKVKKNTKMLAIQHGGNYGLVKYIDKYDNIWDDVFYIWGPWKSDYEYKDGTLKVAPTAKFYNYKKSKDDFCANGILFAGTSLFLHTDVDNYYPHKQKKCEYILRQIDILTKLNDFIGGDLTVRNYNVDYGWRINDCLRKIIPNLNIDENYKYGKFFEALQKCRLFIVDHISTTWLEALYFGKPFIIIVNLDDYIFNSAELKYVKEMQSVGIIRDLDTVDEIGIIYEDVENWWNEPKRQVVVQKIRERYCHNQNVSVDEIVSWWINELLDS